MVAFLSTFAFFFRNLMSLIQLFKLSANMQENSNRIIAIKKEAISLRNLHAFLESAPQIILQCSIFLQTGRISE